MKRQYRTFAIVKMCTGLPVSNVVGTAIDIASAVEAGRFTVKWHLTDAAAQAAHVPRPMKTSHFEKMALFDWLLAAEANVAVNLR